MTGSGALDEGERLFAELGAPDELSLIFNPIGLGAPLSPEQAALHQAQVIERARLVDAAPQSLRENFERARKLHLYGILEYEFFTAAADYALLILEGALRLRFLSYYENRIPVFEGSRREVLVAEDFEPVLKAKGSTCLRQGEEKRPLPRYLKALLDWARRERLLPGKRTRIVDRALSELRNYAAHPIERTVEDPVASARMLRDVAEYINCLWGVRSEDGRLFGGPLRRRARVAAIHASDAAATMELEQVETLPSDERTGTFAVFLAVDAEELILPFQGFAHREGFQGTTYPCERLWSGEWDDLVVSFRAGEFADVEDWVEHRDRVFLVRVEDEVPDNPRSPRDLLDAVDPPEGSWIVVVADDPHEAYSHVRDHEPISGSECDRCYVEVTARLACTGDLVDTLRISSQKSDGT